MTQTNITMKQKQTHRHREQTCVCLGEHGRGKDWELGISLCKLLLIEWINNKVPMHSTGTYIQYPVINHNGKSCEKDWKRMYVCVHIYIYIYRYISESLCCTAEINTILQINHTSIQFLKKGHIMQRFLYLAGKLKKKLHRFIKCLHF